MTNTLMIICCILLLPSIICLIKDYFKNVDPDGEHFWLTIFVAIPVIIILSPILSLVLVIRLWKLWYYRKRPAPLSPKLRDIFKTFVLDRRNVISLVEYNQNHNTNFTLEDVYGKKYVKTLKEEISRKVFDVKIEGLFNLKESFLFWDEEQEAIPTKIYDALFVTDIAFENDKMIGKKKNGNVENLRTEYHHLCQTEDKAEYYNFLGIIYANDSFKNINENTDPEYYFNIAAQKGSIGGAYNSAVWNREKLHEKYEWYLIGANNALNNEDFKISHKTKFDVNITIYINLAIMYHKGIGTEKNEKEAEKWYKIAIKKGSTKAILNLGILYIEQGKKVKAIELYAKAIQDNVTGEGDKEIKKIFMKLVLNDEKFSQYYTSCKLNQMIKDL